jgi:sterol desaturase/sphingolipid hydroxylase (fatty acid hydroxylase superfamily)
MACLYGVYLGVEADHGILVFNLVYLALAVVLIGLERTLPYEKAWLKPDGQTFANLAHTLLNKGAVQILVAVTAVLGLASAAEPQRQTWPSLWPADLPMVIQVGLGLLLAEFGLYWAHRLAHEWALLWRFHAVHHSVTRLWVVNTGRFHFVDTAVSVVFSQAILFAIGAPVIVLLWVSAFTAFVGILTHCNIEMRFGPLSYIFNTPELHRWHHSMVPDEGNTNYGENLMAFDQVFGTFFNPPRRPPVKIGIPGPMPADFLGQLGHPFRASGSQALPTVLAKDKSVAALTRSGDSGQG